MGQLLKLSTAKDITVLMIDSSDHVTGKTGLSAGLTIYLTKAAGTPGVITPTVTELDSTNVKGLYKLALTSGHTDTLGEFQLHITGSGADPTDVSHQIVTDLPGIAQTGDNFARIGAPIGASISADIAAVQSDTDNIQTRIPAALVGGRMDASVGAMAADVITAAAIAAGAGAELAAAVWDYLTASATTAGSLGKLIVDNLNATITSRLASASYTAPPSVGAIADQVWDEAIAGHLGAGSTGEALDNAGAAGSDPWNVSLPGAYAAGKAGFILGTFLDAAISDVLAAIAAVDPPTAAENATELLDQAAGVETNRTVRQAMRLMLAALGGKLSGAGSTVVTIRDTNDTKNRIQADVDASGNRSTVTYDAS